MTTAAPSQASPAPRTPLEIANDPSAPNNSHAQTYIADRAARFSGLASQCEHVLRQCGFATPHPTEFSRAAAIRAQIEAATMDQI